MYETRATPAPTKGKKKKSEVCKNNISILGHVSTNSELLLKQRND